MSPLLLVECTDERAVDLVVGISFEGPEIAFDGPSVSPGQRPREGVTAGNGYVEPRPLQVGLEHLGRQTQSVLEIVEGLGPQHGGEVARENAERVVERFELGVDRPRGVTKGRKDLVKAEPSLFDDKGLPSGRSRGCTVRDQRSSADEGRGHP